MAEIITSNKSKNKHKKLSFDLTPMVDLGFILLTFFVFTTSMPEPKAMNLIVPNDSKNIQQNVCESCAITLIPTSDHKIDYYFGQNKNEMHQTDLSLTGLRKVLLDKKNELYLLHPEREMVVIIEPTEESKLSDFVDVMDEIRIAEIPHYFVNDSQ